jgi:plastocyanin
MHMSMSTRARLLALAIGVALLVTACNGGGDGGDEPAAESTAAETSATEEGTTTTTVTMRDNEYVPADPVVTSGELELVNDGASPHTFTVDGESVDVEVEAGSKATASIDLDPGTYTVFCRFHRSQGMETSLTVS